MFRTNLEKMDDRVWMVKNVSDDMHAMFRAIAHQLYGDESLHAMIREACCDYIQVYSDKFISLLHEPVNTYINNLRLGRLGSQIELNAICNIYNIPLKVYTCYVMNSVGEFKPVILREDLSNYRIPIQISSHFYTQFGSIIEEGISGLINLPPGELEMKFQKLNTAMIEQRLDSFRELELQIATLHSSNMFHKYKPSME